MANETASHPIILGIDAIIRVCISERDEVTGKVTKEPKKEK